MPATYMTAAERNQILEDEMRRDPFPGLRRFSVGVLNLARKLGLAITMNAAAREAAGPVDAQQELVCLCWLLDASNDLDALHAGAALGRERFLREIITPYAQSLHPGLLLGAQKELEMTERGIAAVEYQRPDGTQRF